MSNFYWVVKYVQEYILSMYLPHTAGGLVAEKRDYLTFFYLKSYGIKTTSSIRFLISDIFKCRLHCAGAVDGGGGALVTPNSSLIIHMAILHILYGDFGCFGFK